MSKAPVLSLTHGGGPMPILGDPSQADIAESLRTKAAAELDKASPAAIVLVTAHWEEPYTKVTTTASPQLYYDYYNFPAEAYKFKYPAPGSPDIAKQVILELRKHGLKAESDEERGWDHGVFVPLLLARPQADIPVVQMSVLSSQTPAELFAVGQALQALREKNILIIGSGSASFHSFQAARNKGSDPDFQKLHSSWRHELDAAVQTPKSDDRLAAFKDWQNWEGSDVMHPPGQTEHFSPLIVCAGAVGDLSEGTDKVSVWTDKMLGFEMQNWAWTSA